MREDVDEKISSAGTTGSGRSCDLVLILDDAENNSILANEANQIRVSVAYRIAENGKTLPDGQNRAIVKLVCHDQGLEIGDPALGGWRCSPVPGMFVFPLRMEDWAEGDACTNEELPVMPARQDLIAAGYEIRDFYLSHTSSSEAASIHVAAEVRLEGDNGAHDLWRSADSVDNPPFITLHAGPKRRDYDIGNLIGTAYYGHGSADQDKANYADNLDAEVDDVGNFWRLINYYIKIDSDNVPPVRGGKAYIQTLTVPAGTDLYCYQTVCRNYFRMDAYIWPMVNGQISTDTIIRLWPDEYLFGYKMDHTTNQGEFLISIAVWVCFTNVTEQRSTSSNTVTFQDQAGTKGTFQLTQLPTAGYTELTKSITQGFNSNDEPRGYCPFAGNAAIPPIYKISNVFRLNNLGDTQNAYVSEDYFADGLAKVCMTSASSGYGEIWWSITDDHVTNNFNGGTIKFQNSKYGLYGITACSGGGDNTIVAGGGYWSQYGLKVLWNDNAFLMFFDMSGSDAYKKFLKSDGGYGGAAREVYAAGTYYAQPTYRWKFAGPELSVD